MVNRQWKVVRIQIADAAFSFDKTPAWKDCISNVERIRMIVLAGVPKFDDSKTYINQQIPDAGRILPKLGLKFEIVGQADIILQVLFVYIVNTVKLPRDFLSVVL